MRLGWELRNSRHMCIEYQETSLATPYAGDLAGFHGHTPFGPLDRLPEIFRSPIHHILRRDIVVAPKTCQPDGEDDDNEEGLLIVS